MTASGPQEGTQGRSEDWSPIYLAAAALHDEYKANIQDIIFQNRPAFEYYVDKSNIAERAWRRFHFWPEYDNVVWKYWKAPRFTATTRLRRAWNVLRTGHPDY